MDRTNIQNSGTGKGSQDGTMGLTMANLDTLIAQFHETRAQQAEVDLHHSETLRLASLRQIKSIHQAKVGPGKRWLTLAEIDGWTSIVPARAFKAGELVLYMEIDAFIPASDARFGRLEPLQMLDGKMGHRVKTRKFGSGEQKIVVQGLVFPLEKFREIYEEVKTIRLTLDKGPDSMSEKRVNAMILAMYRKENWAEKLGIKKWEEQKVVAPPAQHARLGNLPTRLFKKTDISRIEDCPNLFKKSKYAHLLYQESVKMDGASMSVYFVKTTSRRLDDLNPLPETVGPNMVLGNGRFGVCSKALDLNELSQCSFGYWRTALRYDLPTKLSKMGRDIAIQGELCGAKIGQNREKIPGDEPDFFVYSMFDMAKQAYIDPREVVRLAGQLGLKHVPVRGYVKIRQIAGNHEDLKKRAAREAGEGLVFKCLSDGRSFKVISTTYLLEHNL